jgi:hypothetical protein
VGHTEAEYGAHRHIDATDPLLLLLLLLLLGIP